jgi:hypothetical protein
MVREERLNRKPISLIAAGGKLIILDERGTLFIGEPGATGLKVLSSASVAGSGFAMDWRSPPVLCAGRIYCRKFAGALVCIDVGKR